MHRSGKQYRSAWRPSPWTSNSRIHDLGLDDLTPLLCNTFCRLADSPWSRRSSLLHRGALGFEVDRQAPASRGGIRVTEPQADRLQIDLRLQHVRMRAAKKLTVPAATRRACARCGASPAGRADCVFRRS